MKKIKILVEENAFGAVKALDVDDTMPIAKLIPYLVQMLQLPQTDLFGHTLMYTLRSTPDGEFFSAVATLQSMGLVSGSRVILDSSAYDTAQSSIITPLDSLSPPDPPSEPRSIRKIAPMRIMGDASAPVEAGLDLALYSDQTIAVPPLALFNDTNTSGLRIPVTPAPRRRTRRRVLFALGAATIAAAGVGTAYAASKYWPQIIGAIQPHLATATPTSQVVVTAPVPAAVPFKATKLFTYTRHKMTVRSLSWSPAGDMLASGSDDKHVFLWQMNGKTVQDLAHPASVTALAWSPGGKRVVTGAGTQVAFFDAQTGNTLFRSTHTHTQAVTSLSWSVANGQAAQVASAALDHHVVLWNTAPYKAVGVYAGHGANAVNAVTWAPNGQTLASGSAGGAVRIWSAVTLKDIHSPYVAQQAIRALSFPLQGTQLAVGVNDGTLNLWQNGLNCQMTNNGSCADTPMALQDVKVAVRSLSWSPDGIYLAVGMNDGHVYIYQPAMKGTTPVVTLMQDGGPVHGIAWSPDGKNFATASGTTVTVWGDNVTK